MKTESRFDSILEIARRHGREYAAGYLASWVMRLEAELEATKQNSPPISPHARLRQRREQDGYILVEVDDAINKRS